MLAPRDQACLVYFGNRVRLAGDFTASSKSLMDALGRFEHGLRRFPELGFGTAFCDAPYYAVTAKLAAVGGGRRALIVFSDGEDNSSAHHMLDTIEAAQIADTRVFAMRYTLQREWRVTARNESLMERIAASIAARNRYGASVMERIARETGGAAFDAGEANVRAIFRQIGEELRASYELAYVSANAQRDGSFREVVIRPRRAGLSVRAKTGYFAK